MNQASKKYDLPINLPEQLSRRLKELSVFGLLVIAIYLLIALLTYHPADPGWSHSIKASVIHNSAGKLGAWLANILLYLLGYLGYLIPVLLIVSSFRLFRSRSHRWRLDQLLIAAHSIGIFLFIIGGCGIAWMHFYPVTALPYQIQGSGGVLGSVVGDALLDTTGDVGSTLFMLAMVIVGFTLYTGLSWLWLIDTTGKMILDNCARLRLNLIYIKDKIKGYRAKKKREHSLLADQQIEEQRPPLDIQAIEPQIKPSVRAEKEKQEHLFEPPAESALPPLSLLDTPPPSTGQYSKEALTAMSRQVELKLKDFGITVEVVSVHPGPVITRFELNLAPGVKGSQISNLAKDLARSLAVVSVRVVDIIPGKSYVGLEIPNEHRVLVTLGEILNTTEYESPKSPMIIALGKDISGQPAVTDLAKMPHLLVAGTTGSGKSVALNAMILSLLYKSTAIDVRLIMIDPKMLELSVYEGIPNLLAPVVTDMKEAANALRWCVAEMDRRYQLMAALGVRNIGGYNKKVLAEIEKGSPIPDPLRAPLDDTGDITYLEKLPYIIVIVDELADMMMTVGKKVEELIARLAQKARAAGIHLILATQRPSVDVITGLIKANVPSRIAFQVSSKVDSRTILDQMGAEHLLGHGDMLFLPIGSGVPERIHGAFVSDNEVHNVVNTLKSHGSPEYIDEILSGVEAAASLDGGSSARDEIDPLYDEAVFIVKETRKASISYIQRRLKIGYNRAARIVEEMENSGLVGPLEANGSREVLVNPPPTVD